MRLISARHGVVRVIEIKEGSRGPIDAALDGCDTDIRQSARQVVLFKHPDDRESAQRGWK